MVNGVEIPYHYAGMTWILLDDNEYLFLVMGTREAPVALQPVKKCRPSASSILSFFLSFGAEK